MEDHKCIIEKMNKLDKKQRMKWTITRCLVNQNMDVCRTVEDMRTICAVDPSEETLGTAFHHFWFHHGLDETVSEWLIHVVHPYLALQDILEGRELFFFAPLTLAGEDTNVLITA